MKKLSILCLALILVFSMAGCSKQLGGGDTAWLSELNHENVESISVEKGDQGVVPGTKTDIYITEDSSEIERLVDAWKNVKLKKVLKVENVGGGDFTEIKFNMKNGDIHTIYLDRNYYIENGEYYEIADIPTMAEDKITRTEQGET